MRPGSLSFTAKIIVFLFVGLVAAVIGFFWKEKKASETALGRREGAEVFRF